MNARIRVALFWLFIVLCVGSAIGYTRWRMGSADRPSRDTLHLYDPTEPQFATELARLRTAPHLFFQSSEGYGRIGVVAIATRDQPKVLDTLECERSHFGRNGGLCLVLNRESMQPRAFAYFLDARFQPLGRLELAGLPIRARVSPDGQLGASTVFVTGENYASEDFTTRTTLFDLSTRQAIADLEQFTVERDGKPFKDVDFNFWGVTFRRDSNQFLATLGTGGKRFLVEGDVTRRHFRVIANDVECPSLSPDERHVVFKRQRARNTGWQLWAMDLDTRASWPITEDQQDIDDQVEWLDDGRVVYGMVSSPQAYEQSLGLWTTSIDQSAGKNRQFFLRSAWSPSVVR